MTESTATYDIISKRTILDELERIELERKNSIIRKPIHDKLEELNIISLNMTNSTQAILTLQFIVKCLKVLRMFGVTEESNNVYMLIDAYYCAEDDIRIHTSKYMVNPECKPISYFNKCNLDQYLDVQFLIDDLKTNFAKSAIIRLNNPYYKVVADMLDKIDETMIKILEFKLEFKHSQN